MEHQEMEALSSEEKKVRFKEATVTHRLLEQTDRAVMRAIREHGGFAYVFVYGPSGVGKTTMIHQVSRRFDGTVPSPRSAHVSFPLAGSRTVVPVLVLETRPQMVLPSIVLTTTAMPWSSWENLSMSIAG
jgi:Cdc6-like AAA superfamily ATPase